MADDGVVEVVDGTPSDPLQYVFFLKGKIKVYIYDFVSISFKARCHMRFQRAFTACCCVFKVCNYFGSNRRNYFENTNAFSKHISYNKILKTLQCVRDLDMLYLGKLGGGGSVLGLSQLCSCPSCLKKWCSLLRFNLYNLRYLTLRFETVIRKN